MSVKFADKPCSHERMAIVQSCQVQMIKNLEVVGAFSAKKIFPENIIFDLQLSLFVIPRAVARGYWGGGGGC